MRETDHDVGLLRRWLDPVLADAGFVWNHSALARGDDGRVRTILYEADPVVFARRYPQTDMEESYGPEQWPPPCIDLWVHLDRAAGRLEVDLEGFEDLAEELRRLNRADLVSSVSTLSDDLSHDGLQLATALAAVLGVTDPSQRR